MNKRELTQEADRLTTLVTEAIHLARIDAEKMRLEKQPCVALDLSPGFSTATDCRRLEPARTSPARAAFLRQNRFQVRSSKVPVQCEYWAALLPGQCVSEAITQVQGIT